jgi:hypothetical protein
VPAAVDLGSAGGVTATGTGSLGYGGAAADSQAANQELGLSANSGSVPSSVDVDGQTYKTQGASRQQMPNFNGQQQQQRALPPLSVRPVQYDSDYGSDDYGYGNYSYGGLQPSSRRLKTPVPSAPAAVRLGARGVDPIDQNGVEIAAIKALTKRLAAAQARLNELRRKA